MSRLILALSSICFLLVCCTQIEYEDTASVQNLCVVQDNHVSEQLVRDLISRLHPTKSDSPSSYSLEAYTDAENDTLMYIVNYGAEEGWQVLSSDTRTPAILAKSGNGCFSLENGSEGFRLWMAGMAHDIKAVKNSRDEDLVFTAEEIAANRFFWKQKPEMPQRGLFPPETDDPIGQWHMFSYSLTEVVDIVPHLTVTQWDQGTPYNAFCPLKANSIDRSLAGCTAIAGAQMLYFLHSKYGLPSEMYSFAICTGNVNSHETTFYNSSVLTWQQMITNSSNSFTYEPESAMIALLGELISANYTNNGTYASVDSLVQNVFMYYGYDCSFALYNESAVKSSLLAGDPVLIDAYSTTQGHDFLIDGYKRTRTHYITEHYFRYPDGTSDPDKPDYATHSYSNPEITAIKMNWGWKNQWDSTNPCNDGWFTLTGGWIVTLNNNPEAFQYNKAMVYGFSVMNQ